MKSSALLLAAAGRARCPPGSRPQQRDLKIEKDTEPASPRGQARRGHPAQLRAGGRHREVQEPAGQGLQLQFAERDAEAIYSILISPEGGNFRAENVHKLIGAKATLREPAPRTRDSGCPRWPRTTTAC